MDNSLKSDSLNDYYAELNGSDLNDFINFIDRYLITYRNQIGVNPSITFGLEIEFCNAPYKLVKTRLERLQKSGIINNEQDQNVHHYHIWTQKIEKSVWSFDKKSGMCGGEIVSPIMKDTKEYWDSLYTICNLIKKANGGVNENTASHIHVGTNILGSDAKMWLRLLKVWAAYENVIYRFSMGISPVMRTKYMDYAKPIRNIIIENMPKLIEYSNVDDTLSLVRTLAFDRNNGLNLKNVKLDGSLYKNTIEIRTPNGTIDPVLWQNNVLFFTKLIEYVASDRYDDDIINRRIDKIKHNKYNVLDLSSALELTDLLFNNNLDKTNFIKQYIKECKAKKDVVLTKKKGFWR